MAEDRFLLDSPAIEKAVAFHNSADYPPADRGRTSWTMFRQQVAGAGMMACLRLRTMAMVQ